MRARWECESINRIRLEFKVGYWTSPTAGLVVLIESDWNLKSFHPRACPASEQVLIESDWNLK